MKSRYWCELAGEPSQHPDDEIGGFDADTGKWICGDCADLGEPVSSPTPHEAEGATRTALEIGLEKMLRDFTRFVP